MIRIEINGEGRPVEQGCTLLDLVGILGLPDQPLALAVDRVVVPRQQWRERTLCDGAKVDIVRAIGGG